MTLKELIDWAQKFQMNRLKKEIEGEKMQEIAMLMMSASECPKCNVRDFWFGMNYDTCEWTGTCNTCGYEEREVDEYAKETWEIIDKAIKEGRIPGLKKEK